MATETVNIANQISTELSENPNLVTPKVEEATNNLAAVLNESAGEPLIPLGTESNVDGGRRRHRTRRRRRQRQSKRRQSRRQKSRRRR